MQELILHPHEAIELRPYESIGAGEEALLIRFDSRSTAQPPPFENYEKMWWATTKQHTGYQTALYHRGGQTKQIRLIPETARPDSFGFDDHTITSTSRIFKVEKIDLGDWLPQNGDTLTYNEKTYVVKQTSNANTFYQPVGNHEIMIRIVVMEYRS